MMNMMELTPEQKVARRKKVLRRFRAIVRLVINNLAWLEETGTGQLTTNVRKNIRMLLKKKKAKSSLTLKEKAVLMQPKEYRTEEDKIMLSKTIGGLKCFRKYPNEVKAKLASVTYFVYYGPDREVVKEGHEAKAMYFILTGECKVTTSYLNEKLNEVVVEEKGTLYPGTTFGEGSLLHGSKRLATITTLTDCQFLMVLKEDFEEVLKETVVSKWLELQGIINCFPYFSVWDDFIKTECQIVARTKSYAPDETVLGDDSGLRRFVHFIISGSCYILEQLNVNYIIKQGIGRYELIPGDYEKQDAFSMNYCRKYHHGIPDNASMKSSRYSTISGVSSRVTEPMDYKKDINIEPKKSETSTASVKTTASKKQKFAGRVSEHDADLSEDEITNGTNPSVVGRLAAFYIPKVRFETHFIKICEFPKGACFNIGEQLVNRRIIALTPLKCLLIPKEFIERFNTGHIFDGVLFFLQNQLPTTEKVFKRFVQEQKFKTYRKRLINELLNFKMVRTHNSINNVPYTIRLKEGLDTDYFNF